MLASCLAFVIYYNRAIRDSSVIAENTAPSILSISYTGPEEAILHESYSILATSIGTNLLFDVTGRITIHGPEFRGEILLFQ